MEPEFDSVIAWDTLPIALCWLKDPLLRSGHCGIPEQTIVPRSVLHLRLNHAASFVDADLHVNSHPVTNVPRCKKLLIRQNLRQRPSWDITR
jgi:hypothetical protein